MNEDATRTGIVAVIGLALLALLALAALIAIGWLLNAEITALGG